MGAAASSGLVAAAARAWLRTLVPLTALSVIALSPVIALALATRIPADTAAASALRVRGWGLLALALPCQLVLVGGASAAAHAPSQLAALGRGVVQLGRAILPCLAASAAIAIGSLALAVPGLMLLALLALIGASPERGVHAAMRDSIAAARARLPAVAITIAAMLAVDLAIGVIAVRAFGAALPRHPTAAQLAATRHLVHAIAAALVAISPLPATVLAMIRGTNGTDSRSPRRRSPGHGSGHR